MVDLRGAPGLGSVLVLVLPHLRHVVITSPPLCRSYIDHTEEDRDEAKAAGSDGTATLQRITFLYVPLPLCVPAAQGPLRSAAAVLQRAMHACVCNASCRRM